MIARYRTRRGDHLTVAVFKGGCFKGVGDTPSAADRAALDRIVACWPFARQYCDLRSCCAASCVTAAQIPSVLVSQDDYFAAYDSAL